MLGLFWELLPILLTALGTWFLVREVSKAHQFEVLDREMTILKEMLDLYSRNLREFWVSSAMESFGWTREEAERAGNLLTDDEIKKGTQESRVIFETQAPAALARWKDYTAPAQLKWRERKLWTGFVLLMMAAAIQAITTAAKYVGNPGS